MAQPKYDPRFPNIVPPRAIGSPDPTGSFIDNPVCKRCLLCSPPRIFTDGGGLRRHMIVVHNHGDDGKRLYSCECGARFRTCQQLGQHNQSHLKKYERWKHRILNWKETEGKKAAKIPTKTAARKATTKARQGLKEKVISMPKVFRYDKCERGYRLKINFKKHLQVCPKQKIAENEVEGRPASIVAPNEHPMARPSLIKSASNSVNKFGLNFSKRLPSLKKPLDEDTKLAISRLPNLLVKPGKLADQLEKLDIGNGASIEIRPADAKVQVRQMVQMLPRMKIQSKSIKVTKDGIP